jgi:hypothetical protein
VNKKRAKYKAANFRWTSSSLWASVAVILLQTGEIYSNSDLTKVKYESNKLSIVDEEKVNIVRVPNFVSIRFHASTPTANGINVSL